MDADPMVKLLQTRNHKIQFYFYEDEVIITEKPLFFTLYTHYLAAYCVFYHLGTIIPQQLYAKEFVNDFFNDVYNSMMFQMLEHLIVTAQNEDVFFIFENDIFRLHQKTHIEIYYLLCNNLYWRNFFQKYWCVFHDKFEQIKLQYHLWDTICFEFSYTICFEFSNTKSLSITNNTMISGCKLLIDYVKNDNKIDHDIKWDLHNKHYYYLVENIGHEILMYENNGFYLCLSLLCKKNFRIDNLILMFKLLFSNCKFIYNLMKNPKQWKYFFKSFNKLLLIHKLTKNILN